MPRIANTTNAQTKFLRSFRNPKGPPPDAWPSSASLAYKDPRFPLPGLESLYKDDSENADE